ncbi:hypothetical protein [uncultured Kriegella sp.]|uniref:hypothetical protein n=1 Tax=uncultured Kriegella sp. TaxID=1798910 RepID=UPI0030DBDD2C|tara:strand:- start:187150 stop:187755 length:606 start_codon:yes stop_codon:yes gene_type:complete
MRLFAKLISYLSHPLFIPIAGTICYFIVTPKYTPREVQTGTILPIFILTVIIPIISYFILRNVGMVSSIFMPNLKERKYPLYIHIVLLLMIVYKVIPNYDVQELHYYFLGLIIASMSTLILLLFNIKSSMHLLGLGSLLTFLLTLSIHFSINLTLAISLITLLTGLVSSARLYLQAHTKAELFIGFSIGMLSQLLLIQFWL